MKDKVWIMVLLGLLILLFGVGVWWWQGRKIEDKKTNFPDLSQLVEVEVKTNQEMSTHKADKTVVNEYLKLLKQDGFEYITETMYQGVLIEEHRKGNILLKLQYELRDDEGYMRVTVEEK